MKLVSLYSGCGGLDLGFEKAGFKIIWANEFDKNIWSTFERNFPTAKLDKNDVRKVSSKDIPSADGIIGGPPCQSWSEAGSKRGIKDKRGQLFFEYVRIIEDKKPKFFLAENVSGILHKRHSNAFETIIKSFEDIGYRVTFNLLNASDYSVPQDRKRVIIVGYREDLGIKFIPPNPIKPKLTLEDSIKDLDGSAVPALQKNYKNTKNLKYPNHEYYIGDYSSMYMSRNRVRSWDEQSFTIQAGARHAPIHPQANKMLFVEKDKRIFDPNSPKPYRRLSVRECARIQTFPDDFIFDYENVAQGYKMIGNAVPVNFAYHLAKKIKKDLEKIDE
jgi:DNA (cytosine-5)-methyltransferase 1